MLNQYKKRYDYGSTDIKHKGHVVRTTLNSPFEEVYNKSFTKGEVKTEDGKFPSPSEGKEVEEVKIKITPSNYPFYNSREDSAAGEKMRDLIDSGKFELFSSVKRTFAYRKEAAGEALTGKADELKGRKKAEGSM